MTPTIVTSKIPAAKAALVAIITALVDDDVDVTWGRPVGEEAREWILVGNVTGRQRTAAMGQRRREETFTITVTISVLEETGDNQVSSERAFALLALIENDLRFTHTDLSGTVREALIEDPVDLAERLNGARAESQITVGIACSARI